MLGEWVVVRPRVCRHNVGVFSKRGRLDGTRGRFERAYGDEQQQPQQQPQPQPQQRQQQIIQSGEAPFQQARSLHPTLESWIVLSTKKVAQPNPSSPVLCRQDTTSPWSTDYGGNIVCLTPMQMFEAT